MNGFSSASRLRCGQLQSRYLGQRAGLFGLIKSIYSDQVPAIVGSLNEAFFPE
jgi:hypothetical protein